MFTETGSPIASSEGAVPRAPAESTVTDAYIRHYAALVRFVTARTRDSDLAADIAQEAFLRLIRETSAGRAPVNVMAWLCRVAVNLVVTRSRRAHVADRWAPWLRPVTDAEDSPEGRIIGAERTSVVRDAVARLSAAERDAIVLAAEGYAGREIARVIGRSEGATRTLMCRARSRLRIELAAVEAG